MAAARFAHGHTPRPAGSLAHLSESAYRKNRAAQINGDFAAAVEAAAGRTVTLADAAKRLGVQEASVLRYCYSRGGGPAKLAAVRDEAGRIVGVTQASFTAYRRARATHMQKVAAYRKTRAALAA